jgi:tRNA dimethylallyltransferase
MSTSTTAIPLSADPNSEQPPNNHNKNLVVILAGPTGVGKSDVAAQLCASQKGVIVSADSVQAYRGVCIGANKPTMEERQETPHILVDVVDHRTENYNAAEWRRDALHVISNLLLQSTTDNNNNDDAGSTRAESSSEAEQDTSETTRERREEVDKEICDARKNKGYQDDEPIIPVVVGGTMMYLQWLVHGRPDAAKPTPKAIQRAHTELGLYQSKGDWEGAVEHVTSHGPLFAQRLTKLCGRDWYRLRRTLEIALTVQEGQQSPDGEKSSEMIRNLFSGQREGRLDSYGYDVRCFFLCPDNRMKHTELVDQRCEAMLTRGLLEETANLKLAGEMPSMAARAIGYKQTLDYLEREDAKDNDEDAFNEYLNQFSTATRRYSKKQMQWFRKDDQFVFVPVSVGDEKRKRVKDAAIALEHFINLPRDEFERECFSNDSVSAKTQKANEDQGKTMKFYQFQRYILKPGTSELERALQVADQCTNQLQAKKQKSESSVVK